MVLSIKQTRTELERTFTCISMSAYLGSSVLTNTGTAIELILLQTSG